MWQGKDSLFDNTASIGVDPRALAQRIMEVCTAEGGDKGRLIFFGCVREGVDKAGCAHGGCAAGRLHEMWAHMG